MTELQPLKEAAEKASVPGDGSWSCYESLEIGDDEMGHVCTAESPDVATFIALANPSTILSLLSRLEALEGENERLKAELEHWQANHADVVRKKREHERIGAQRQSAAESRLARALVALQPFAQYEKQFHKGATLQQKPRIADYRLAAQVHAELSEDQGSSGAESAAPLASEQAGQERGGTEP